MSITMKTALLAVAIFAFVSSAGDAQAVKVENRKHVSTTVKPLNLNRAPSTDDIMAAGQLGGALHPTHDQAAGSSRDAVNLSFGAAMEKWNRHEYKKAAQLLKQHVASYPQSPWASEALLHLGCDAQYNGRYAEAQKHFERVLRENRGKEHSGAKALVDKASLRMGVLKAFQNNLPEAQNLFKELYKNAGDWRERTYAGHWIQRIGKMKKSGTVALNCGNQALAALLERDGRKDEADSILKLPALSGRGQSVRELEEGSARFGYPLVARSFAPDKADTLYAPAIVHLPSANLGDSGHYWLFEGKDDDGLKFFDPQAGKHFIQTADEFSEQWDGVALIKAGHSGGEPLGADLSGSVFGGCCGVPRAEEDLGCPDDKCKQGPSMNGGTPNGSPTWTVNMVNMNFYMTDIPLWYKSPIGPAVEIQLSYNSQSAIAVHEPFGRKWQFNYSSYLVVDTAKEVTIFMPDGRRDVYRPNNPANPAAGYKKPYRVFNTLVWLAENRFELRLPEGDVYTYAIPAGTSSLQPFLVEIRDTHNQKLTFGYNADVELTSITDAAGKNTILTYTGGLVTRVSDPFGRHADFSYDANRNLTGITDMGGYASSFTYDANVYLTGITNGGGTWQVYIEPADGIDNNMVKYPLPGAGMWENYRITVTNPQAGKEEYYYDGYHGTGWYKSPRHYGSDIKTRAYDFTTTLASASGSRGELQTLTSPQGVVTYFSYDTNGQVLQETDGHGHATDYAYNSMGRITQVTRPNLQATTFGYAANGVDTTSITNGLGTISLVYNATRDISAVNDRMGAATTLAYNAYGQLASITDSLLKTTAYSYDVGHFLTQVSRDGLNVRNYTYDSVGRIRTATDTTGVTLTFDYNNLDDLTKITWPDGKFITATYSTAFPHLVTSVTDRAGRTTSYAHDSLKRLIQVTNPEGGVTRFTYDKDGNLILMALPSGGLTRYFYNNDGQLKTKMEPDGTRTSYLYDAGGLLKAFVNGRLATSTYSYDINDNLTGVTYSDGTAAITYNYDVFDRLVSMVDAVGTHGYTYDKNDRLTSIDGPWTSDTITYSYDSLGRRTGVSVQGGLATTRVFDALGRLISVTNSAGTYGYGYSGASPRISTLTRPNGSASTYLYDSLSRLSSLTNKSSSNATISSYAYLYNAQDQRSQETIVSGTSFPLNSGSLGYDYDYANKLLSATTPVTFSYDADGNMTGGLTPEGYLFSAAYDANNQLVSFEYTDGSATVRKTTYGYNGLGFLEKEEKYNGGSLAEQTLYIRDRTALHQERSIAGAVTVASDYTWGSNYGGGIGGLLGLKRGSAAYSYLHDGRGNVTGVLDSAQSVVAGYAYDPFGVLLSKSGTLDQPFRFSTKLHDESTGLSYYGYRHYAPAIGRWMSRDPMEEAGGLNLYQFANNNSLTYADPDGRNPIVVGLALGVGIGMTIVYWDEIKEWWDSDSTQKNAKKVKDAAAKKAEKEFRKACGADVKKPRALKEYEQQMKETEKRSKDSVNPLGKGVTGVGEEAAGALGGY